MVPLLASFDIFDTCLIRKCGDYRYSYDFISTKAFIKDVPESVRQEFVCARIEAENKANTLEEIYKKISFSHKYLKQTAQLIESELECERMMLVPVFEVKQKIQSLRNKGVKIVFISDMYLPSKFLASVLEQNGLKMMDETLYVSCECGCSKRDGKIFPYVSKNNNIKYNDWVHFGDDKLCDFLIPKRLGIKSILLSEQFEKYEKSWMKNISLGYPYYDLLAGISRAIRLSQPYNRHRDMLADVVSPFYVAFACHILSDAILRGIDNIFFFARDTYDLYNIAKLISETNKASVNIHYLYISQKSLYNCSNKKIQLQYFESIGLANKEQSNAIVDLCSSGHGLQYMNDLLKKNSYKTVFGYYFENYCFPDSFSQYMNGGEYSTLINGVYATNYSKIDKLRSQRFLMEMFFSIHNSRRTIDYVNNEGKPIPIFDDDHESDEVVQIKDSKLWSEIHTKTLITYTTWFLELGLDKYYSEILANVAIPTLYSFLKTPKKYCLEALLDVSAFNYKKEKMLPYIKKMTIWETIVSRGKKTIWRKGSYVYTFGDTIINVAEKIVPFLK